MVRFPTGLRHAPRPQYASGAEPQDGVINYEDLLKSASFSPGLSFLLALMLKDGMSRAKALNMLREIEPYVSDGDKAAIHGILGAVQISNDFRNTPADPPVPRVPPELSEYSRPTRQNYLIETMLRYAGRGAASSIKSIKKMIEMRDEYERTLKRLRKLKSLNMNSTEDVIEAMSMFMPPEQIEAYQNMQNLLKMMGSMKDIRPEDIFRQMGGGRHL